eukprot:3902896-Rhodomonas_salina.2
MSGPSSLRFAEVRQRSVPAVAPTSTLRNTYHAPEEDTASSTFLQPSSDGCFLTELANERCCKQDKREKGRGYNEWERQRTRRTSK